MKMVTYNRSKVIKKVYLRESGPGGISMIIIWFLQMVTGAITAQPIKRKMERSYGNGGGT